MVLKVDSTTVEAAARDLAAAGDATRAALRPANLAAELEPLRVSVAASWTGPYAGVLSRATTVETNPPAVVTGGTTRVLSGGGTASDVVFGAMFGGGRRVGTVRATGRARGHRRRTTAQFKGQTLAADRGAEAGMDAAAENIADTVERTLGGGP